jgi:hypothetical protein
MSTRGEVWRLTVSTHSKWDEWYRCRAEILNRWEWVLCSIKDSRRARIERVTRMREAMGPGLVNVPTWGSS